MKKIEKLFSDIGREAARKAPFLWEKICIYSDVKNGIIDSQCFYINDKGEKTAAEKGSKVLNGYFIKYREIVEKNEGKSWKSVKISIWKSGHIEIEISYEAMILEGIYEKRLEDLKLTKEKSHSY